MGLLENIKTLHELNYKLFGVEDEENKKIVKGLVENIITHIVTYNVIDPSTKTGDGKPVIGKIK